MKKNLPLFLSIVFFINSVSAQFFDSFGGGYGSYGSFSITDFFERFGPDNIIYLSLFLILFVFLSAILKRTGIFRDHQGFPDMKSIAIISLSISLMSVYGIYRTSYDFTNLFYNIGFSAESLYPVLGIILLLTAVFIMWKFRIGVSLMILGILLGLTAFFTEVIYDKNIALLIAGALIVVGFFLLRKVRMGIAGSYDWQKEKRQWKGRSYVMILGVLGVILGLVLGNTIAMIIGGILTLIGFGLWNRKRSGSYRPLGQDYYPKQEMRQLRAGTPLLFLGAIIAILGLVLGNDITVIVGSVLAAIGFLLRIFR
ncbi:MAG: hypothetical protein AABX91_00260, partial [Nanoarchaeota archaeon]